MSVALSRIAQALEPSVLRVVSAPGGMEQLVQAPVIYDPVDPPSLSAGTIVLAVGTRPGRELSALMERLASDEVVMACKLPAADLEAVGQEAFGLGLALLAVAQGASWTHLLTLLRSVMTSEGEGRGTGHVGGVATGDLFAVANAISALIDAPVTIEDPQSRVLAYSGRQDEADEARMATILGRQIPDVYYRQLQAKGVFRRLYGSPEPLYLDAIADGVLPRLAVGVRAGDEVLGSIWAVVRAQPAGDKLAEFAAAASNVAIHLLRHQLSSDVRRGLQSALVSAVLTGGGLASDSANRLGLAGEGFRVLAVGMLSGDAIDNEVNLLRAWDALSMHLSVAHRRAVSAVIEGIVYAVIPAQGGAVGTRHASEHSSKSLLSRLPASLQTELVIAVGPHVADLGSVPQSREQADRLLRLLRAGAATKGRLTGVVDDLRLQLLLRRTIEVAADESGVMQGPLTDLLDHDRDHHTHHVATLRAYLESFGDIPAAARAMGIHPNSFRYRLQKLQGMPGIDLGNGDERLALSIQLRLLTGATPPEVFAP